MFDSRKQIKYIFISSFIIKIFATIIVTFLKGISLQGDESTYILYANKILNSGIWSYDPTVGADGLVGPIFPVIIAILFYFFGNHYFVIYFFNAVLSAGLTIIAFYLGKTVCDDKVGLYASIWTMVYGLYYKWIPFLLKETFVFFVFALIIYLLFSETKEKITFRFVLLIIIYTIFIHADERYLFYLPFFSIFIFVLNRHRFKTAALKGGLFLLAVILLMIPWTVRNYVVRHEIMILTSRVHRTDIIKNKVSKNRLKEETETSRHYLTNAQIDSIAAGLKTYGRHPLEVERIKQGIIPRKYSIWERWYYEFIEFWTPVRLVPGYSGNGFRLKYRSLRHNLVTFFSLGVILPFFIIGIYRTVKLKNLFGMILLGIISLHTFLHVFLLWSVYRYRVPIDLFVIVLAAFGFEYFLQRMKTFKPIPSTSGI